MKEYIERAALKRELAPYEENDFSQQMDVILAIVDAQPAADVVEVVRCHNCKRIYANANDPGVIYCGWSKEPTPPDGYCHRGERTHGQGGRAWN